MAGTTTTRSRGIGRFGRRGATVVSVLALVLALAVSEADAGSPSTTTTLPTPDLTITVSPSTVTYGTEMTVSGSTCIDGTTGSGEGLVVLVTARSLNFPSPLDPTGARLGLADVQADGSWTFTYVIPDEAPNFTFSESFGRNVEAYCAPIGPGQGALLEYDPAPITFEVPTPVTPTSVPAAPPAPGPAPAEPVAGAANFTG